MSSDLNTVSNAMLRRYWLASEEIGLSPAELLALTGLSSNEVMFDGGRVRLSRLRRVSELFPSLPNQAAFFNDGMQRLFSDHPNLGAVCANSQTMRAALDAYGRYRRVIADWEGTDWLASEGTFVVRIAASNSITDTKSSLASMGDVVAIARHYSTGAPPVVHCAVAGLPPKDRQVIDDYLGCRVRYNADLTELVLKDQNLDARYEMFNEFLHARFLTQLTMQCRSIDASSCFSELVKHAIQSVLEDEFIASSERVLEKVCEQLKTTRSTLWRRLSGEMRTYSELFADVRLELAQELLLRHHLSLTQISERLGFSSQSAFSRFFKARTGMAPKAIRGR